MSDNLPARLPNADRAVVEDGKLAGYLLNVTHPAGGPKARFFLAHGFSSDRPDDLRAVLIAHGHAHPVERVQLAPHGSRYIVVGPLTLPDGAIRTVRTVWQFDHGMDFPRLLTAHPDE